jgi:hypothetical protein
MELIIQEEYKRVDFTEVKTSDEKIHISTVWLGMDHGFGGDKEIFETMVFGGNLRGHQRRYATELEALTGHNEVVELVKETLFT